MNPHGVLAALAICISLTGCANAGKIPRIEQGIYRPTPPLENIKQHFYVRERERPVLDLITEASIPIARFLLEFHASPDGSVMPHVLAEARDSLRLPPNASRDSTRRYVGSLLYCWKSKDNDHLEFLIEWGDITTNARYTDSYVFVRRGPSWYFEQHGSIPPWHWKQTERYFQRACPSTTSE